MDNRLKFINQIAAAAVQDMRETNVLASITIAQACLESAWGQSAPGNNLFGIKGSGTTQSTQEFINGKWVTIQAGFRAYADWLGSMRDHSKFLIENGRYARAGFFDCCTKRDYAAAARALQTAGYATDPQYANKLIQIIESNNLQKYDLEADKMNSQIEALEAQVKSLLDTARAHVERIQKLESKNDLHVPEWAQEATDAAVKAGLIDTPDGGSYDFYRLVTVLYRKKLI